MAEFIAVVGWEDTKLAKYQGFDKEADADTHVTEYGGFVVADPGGAQSHWVVDPVAKTVIFDEATFNTDKAQSDWLSAMEATDNDIPRELEDLYDAMPPATQSKVAKKTRDKIIAKKELRGTKP